ncbi:hypothetical protein [Acinetobacter modestus]|uniref:hypothetical protein n=1 Tax=Acinetobacter modestus TaxID=1776740 RepID=UPI003018FA70
MNFIFKHAKNYILNNSIDLEKDHIVVVLLNEFSEINQNMKLLSEIPKNLIATEPVNLNDKTFKNCVFDAQDVRFNTVCGDVITGLLIYEESSKLLIAYVGNAFNLPVYPNGGDIIVTWENGYNKIFNMYDDFKRFNEAKDVENDKPQDDCKSLKQYIIDKSEPLTGDCHE